jgi:D-3-phosphoglycerate dehydrogenase
MIASLDEFKADFEAFDFDVTVPKFTQEMTEDQLCEMIGGFDGWIIGDDPASRAVVATGVNGRLKACMRWGVGTNNVDFDAFKEFNIPIANTPGVFGREVADIACHYVTALARNTYHIDQKVKAGDWYKPVGTSLWAQSALIVGMGDVGQQLSKRLYAHDIEVTYHDPYVKNLPADINATKVTWPYAAALADFLIFTAPLTEQTYHIFNEALLDTVKPGIKIINVGRGPLIDEQALVKGLKEGIISAAALDVLEKEPIDLELHKSLLAFSDRLILGSHNGSNTFEAVSHVSRLCIRKLHQFLQNGI